MDFAVFQGAGRTPFVADTRLGPILERASVASGARVCACARDAGAREALQRIGLMTYDELLDGLERGAVVDGCASATHVRRNDGRLFGRWPALLPIPWYSRGFDVEAIEIHAFRREIEKQHFYPVFGDQRGPWRHCNLRMQPTRTCRVKRAAGMLYDMGYLPAGMLIGPIDLTQRSATDAIRSFQRDSGQEVDGVVGPRTARQLACSHRCRP